MRTKEVVGVSLGFPVIGISAPVANRDDADTVILAFMRRMAREMPIEGDYFDPVSFDRLRQFYRAYMHKTMRPLYEDEVMTFVQWLATRPYNNGQKIDLAKALYNYPLMMSPGAYKLVQKIFGKAESLPQGVAKPLRDICNSDDLMKGRLGPVVSSMESLVYNIIGCVKHVPVNERAELVRNVYAAEGRVMGTDWTAQEAHFKQMVQRILNYERDCYMLQNVLCGASYLEWQREFFLKPRKFLWKRKRNGLVITVTIEGVETGNSGDNITSMRNLEANLVTMLFVMLEGVHGPATAANNWHMNQVSELSEGQEDFKRIAEGDDGLFRDLMSFLPTLADFVTIGFASKPVECRFLEDSDFCGQITTAEPNVSIGNVLYILVDMGWSNTRRRVSKRLRLQLARAKGISYSDQYNGSPVVYAMAKWVLRSTKHVDMRGFDARSEFDEYKMKIYENALTRIDRPAIPVTDSIRQLCERRFGLRVDEQIRMERFFNEAPPELQPLSLPIEHLVPEWWLEYTRKYVMPRRESPIFGYPRRNNYGDAEWQVVFEDGPRIAGAE